MMLAVTAAKAQEKGVPTTWDEMKLHEMELPLVGLDKPVTHAPLEFYNAVPVLAIAKSYPVYQPSKEPQGYMDALRHQEEETVAFDPKHFRTEADWIKAGEVVFHAPDTGRGPSIADAHDPDWYKGLDVPGLVRHRAPSDLMR